MAGRSCFLWMIIAILLLPPVFVFSQNKPGQSVVTAGAGVSMIGLASYVAINGPNGTHKMYVSPAFSGHYDIGLTDFFSLGFAGTHQVFKLDYHYNVYNSAGASVTEYYTDKLIRSNYGIRGVFHFGNSEKTDIYAGPRVGFTMWNVSTTNPDTTFIVVNNQPYFLRISSKSNSIFTIQGLFGMRYFFNKYIGINYEISIGAPVFFMLGVNGRF